jgi:hypothetical protein
MKKIISPNIKGSGPTRLADKLRSLVAEDLEIAALDGQITIYEAWALDGDRVKVQVEMRLPDQSYRMLTRVVSFPLPPETKVSYRDWTITVTPSWYGFGWRVFDESGAAVGESSEDVHSAEYAQKNAQRDVDRHLAERVMREFQSTKLSGGRKTPSPVAPPSIPLSPTPPPAQPEETSPAPTQTLPAPVARAAVEIEAAAAEEKNDASLLPAILAGHYTPGVAEKVNRFYSAVGEIFEAWVRRRGSAHTRRAYRTDVMSFVKFMELAWPEEATRLLTVKISDVLTYVEYVKLERDMGIGEQRNREYA